MSTRGRPRNFDRDQALDAAMTLFWEKGYSATSISELCSAMDIGSPSLYAAFTSKEALYVEAVTRYREVVTPSIWKPVYEVSPVREAVEQFLMESADVLTLKGRPGGCMVTLSNVGSEGPQSLGCWVQDLRQTGVMKLEERIAEAVAEGELPADTDVQTFARFIIGVQQGMSVQARDGASRESLQQVARMAMTVWPVCSQD
ncbi:TetR/AcrR family transcriptional regulator [Pseudomonas sp. BIGb0164]|uniref:TetR/AcrR family transcriptional regulator n=1 Tax=Pseudomonas sp. BIGb0164 TaxID=2940605 RepID=UPI002168CA25|nr:TetR/AcrR family transcriptional regulator [Pseudomonas sp. BIGb0164]MCS4249990.1 AcrR family transcriptional regulator [Pseudomonas sp. BIGb0164]